MDGAYHTGDDCPDDDGYRIELTIDHGGRIRQSFEDVGDDIVDDRYGDGYGGHHAGSVDDGRYGYGSGDATVDIDDTDESDESDESDEDNGTGDGDEDHDDGPDRRYASSQEDDCPPVTDDCPPDGGSPRVTPVPVDPAQTGPTPDLDDHPALAAIHAQSTQDTLNTLDDEVDALENRLGMPGGVPTAQTAVAGVQAPGGGLQTTSGMPLVTLGSGTTEGSILSAALAPLPGGLDVKGLVFDEHGMLRPNAGVWAPSLAALRGQSIDPALVDRFGSQLNDPDPIGFGRQDPDPSLIPPSER